MDPANREHRSHSNCGDEHVERCLERNVTEDALERRDAFRPLLLPRSAGSPRLRISVMRSLCAVKLLSTRRKAELRVWLLPVVKERFLAGHVMVVMGLLREGLREGQITDRHNLVVLAPSTAALALFPQVVLRRMPPDAIPFIQLPGPAEAASAFADVLLHGIGVPVRAGG